jgi:cell division protein ZapA
MSNLALTIGGRSFSVACEDGEEAHVEALGRAIDAKVASVEGAAQQSESRMLLFAALMLADELSDRGPSLTGVGGERLTAIAARLENLAVLLEAAAAED